MTTKQILAEGDGLADADRVKRMIALGKEAREVPETAALGLGGQIRSPVQQAAIRAAGSNPRSSWQRPGVVLSK